MDSETVSVKIGRRTYDRIKALAEADYRPIRSTIELLLADALTRRSEGFREQNQVSVGS